MEKNTNFSNITAVTKTIDIDFANKQLANGWVLLEICKKNDVICYVDKKPVLDEYVEFVLGKLQISHAQQLMEKFNSK